jgi:hypothetical protein
MTSILYNVAGDGSLSVVQVVPDGTPAGDNQIVSNDPDVLARPDRFAVSNGTIGPVPYLVLTMTPTGSYSISAPTVFTTTVALQGLALDPPASSVTLMIGNASISLALTGNAAHPTIALHPAVAQASFPAVVTASGYASDYAKIGAGGSAVPVQAIQTGQTSWLIAPTTYAQVRQWLFGFGPQTDMVLDTLTHMLHELYWLNSILADAVFRVIMPQLQQSSYSQLSLSANAANALADLQAQLLTHTQETLENLYPAGGQRDALYANTITWSPQQKQAIQAYLSTVSSIPNLS